MTLGEKITAARKQAGLSQAELAERIFVSRQAVSKWENDRGLPDIENIKALSGVFGVSLDYLVGMNENTPAPVLIEPIDIAQYQKSGKARDKYDAVIRDKYPNAQIIYPLIRRKKLGRWESIIDFIVQPGIFQTADALSSIRGCYVVDMGSHHLLVNVSQSAIESRELPQKFVGRKKIIGENIFVKAPYTL